MNQFKGIQIFSQWIINFYHKIQYLFDRSFPKELNPLANIGAIANITFIIAIVTGVLLLFWYAPSVHVAHSSVVEMMTNKAWYAGIVRSLHRYSSDACVLFMCLHIFDIILLKKYDRPRWPAWVTGIFLFIVILFEGWIGYWLVWDEGAKYIAVATAKLMDVIPIFAEPMSRSFLTKDSINSLFFFVVFFGHMLIPLLVAILLWLHISRLSKPKLFTNKPLTIYIVLSLIIISIIQPAPYGELADVQRLESAFPLDYFYVLPLYIVHYFNPIVSWLIFLITILLLISIPFLVRSRKQYSSSIIEDNCHACRSCFNDCPFNAISMISIGKNEKNHDIIKANVDSDLCVQCGICVGSCSTDAISFPLIQKSAVEQKLDTWLHDPVRPFKGDITFLCQDALDPNSTIDDQTGECNDLPGNKVIVVPCSGWINVDLLDKLNKEKSINHIHVVHCSSTTSYSRLGSEWAKNRIEGHRYPKLKIPENQMNKVQQYEFYPYQWKEGVTQLLKNSSQKVLSINKARILSLCMIAITMGFLLKLSDIPYREHNSGKGRIIISFKHPAIFKVTEASDDQVNQKKLRHMKRKNEAKRTRENVVLEISINGEKILNKVYQPSGLFKDGISLGMEEIDVHPGKYEVEITLKESENNTGNVYTIKQMVEATKDRNVVVLFDKGGGFKWY